MESGKEYCGVCRFFSSVQTQTNIFDRMGSCRRRAPTTESTTLAAIGVLLADLHWKEFGDEGTHQGGMVSFERQPEVVWPYVSGSEWCGEFEEKKDER